MQINKAQEEKLQKFLSSDKFGGSSDMNQNQKMQYYLSCKQLMEQIMGPKSEQNDRTLEDTLEMIHASGAVSKEDFLQMEMSLKDSGKARQLTFEYDKEGKLVAGGDGDSAQDTIKKSINREITKTLESFKLEEGLEEDIASAIASSISKNGEFMKMAEELLDENSYFGSESVSKSKYTREEIVEALKELRKKGGTAKEAPAKTNPKTASATPKSSPKPSAEHITTNESTPSVGTSATAVSSKKKKKKKKKKTKPADSGWLCEFCQYEKVFGTKPVTLLRWYNKKLKEQEKREAYQRQRLRGKKNKKKIDPDRQDS